MKLKNVIQEEIQKVLSESYTMEHENFRFTQRIKNSSFYNYQGFSTDYDIDINESDVIINWHMAFWLNDFGVENFIIEADSVSGTYKLGYLDKQSDEVVQEDDKDIAEFPWKFQVEDVALYLGKTLYVESLDFDFKSKICRVTFFDYGNQ